MKYMQMFDIFSIFFVYLLIWHTSVSIIHITGIAEAVHSNITQAIKSGTDFPALPSWQLFHGARGWLYCSYQTDQSLIVSDQDEREIMKPDSEQFEPSFLSLQTGNVILHKDFY